MNRLLTALALAAALLTSSPVSAESLEDGLAQAYADSARGLKILRDGGFEYGRVLTLERVPSGAFVVEIALERENTAVRYPLKLQRNGGQWTVVWQPAAEYAAGFVGAMSEGVLPSGRAERAWVDEQRLPALPVVVSNDRLFTPFGAFDSANRADGKSQGDLDVSPLLVQHTQKWIRQVLENDPGPAGVDLLLTGTVDWKLLNKVIFNTSMSGLYQLTLVTVSDGEVGAVTAASPVTTSTGAPPRTLIAVNPRLDGFGVTLRIDGKTLEPSDACGDGLTFCVEAAGEMPDQFERHWKPQSKTVMFAATGTMQARDAVAMLASIIDYAGYGDHRVVLGYIQK